MTTHSKLSPSKRHRWGLCAASIREEANYPEQASGPAAIAGTHTHTLLEFSLVNGFTPTPGMTLNDHEGTFVIDDEQYERVCFAMAYINKRMAEVPNARLLTESRVGDILAGRTDLGGTVDVQIHGDDLIEIIDYKDGMGVVEAEGNLQLEQYALGAVIDAQRDINGMTIRTTIIQPKLRKMGMSGVVWSEQPAAMLMDSLSTLLRQAQATEAPDAPYTPGESQCRYCPAKGGCKGLYDHSMAATGINFDSLAVAQEAANIEPSQLSGEKLREMVEAAPLIRQLLDAAEAEALARFGRGESIAGLKIVHGRGSRSWLGTEEEIAAKLTRMGIPKASIWTTKLVTPAQAPKLVWEKRDGTKHQLSEAQIGKLDQFISKSAGKLTVVPESDRREAVEMNVANLFAAVDPVKVETETLPSWLI